MKSKTLHFIIMILLLLNIYTLFKLSSLKSYVENRLHQSDYANSNLRNEITSIYSNVENKLKKQASILDNHNITLGELKPDDLTVPITLSITPKELKEGLTASLKLNEKSFPMNREGTSFIGTANANIFENFQLKIVLEEKGVQKVETIDEYFYLKDKYLLQINGGFGGESSYGSREIQYKGSINLDFYSSQFSMPKKVTLVKDINENIVSSESFDASSHINIPFNEKIKLSNGEKLSIYALIEDINGLQYKYIITTYVLDSSGNVVRDDKQWLMNRTTEIRDKNGKLLFEAKDDFLK